MFDVTQVKNPIYHSKKNSLLSQFILENLKISLYFCILNPKNSHVILPVFEFFLKSKLLLRYKHFWDLGIFLKAGDTGSIVILNTFRLVKLLTRFSFFNLITQQLHLIFHIKIHSNLSVARQIPTFVQVISQQQTVNLDGSFWKQTLQTMVVKLIRTRATSFVCYITCFFILQQSFIFLEVWDN